MEILVSFGGLDPLAKVNLDGGFIVGHEEILILGSKLNIMVGVKVASLESWSVGWLEDVGFAEVREGACGLGVEESH